MKGTGQVRVPPPVLVVLGAHALIAVHELLLGDGPEAGQGAQLAARLLRPGHVTGHQRPRRRRRAGAHVGAAGRGVRLQGWAAGRRDRLQGGTEEQRIRLQDRMAGRRARLQERVAGPRSRLEDRAAGWRVRLQDRTAAWRARPQRRVARRQARLQGRAKAGGR